MKVKSEKLSPQTCSWLWQFWYRTVYNISVSAQQHALCNKKMKINKMYKIEQEIRSVELGVCPMQLFYLKQAQRDVHPVQNLLLCTKFHGNRMTLLRYGDITIFKIAAVRHLGIVLPPYETTHEVAVAGRSCPSNFMSIWYTNMKI